MVDITIGYSFTPRAFARVTLNDLLEGKRRIHIGNNLTEYREMRLSPREDMAKWFTRYNSRKEIYENNIEPFITHETIHIILHELEGSIVCSKYDNIDSGLQISGSGVD